MKSPEKTKLKGNGEMNKTKLFKKMSAVTLAVIMAMLSGCSGEKEVNNGNGSKEMPKEISIFAQSLPSLKEDMADYNSMLGFQIMEEETGCHINWTIAPATGATEKFNLMIASGQYTDAIISQWETEQLKEFSDDGVILPLGDMIKENMPNFMKWCEENPDYYKQIIDMNGGSGEIYYLPYIRADKRLNIFIGPQMRTDWLEKLNLEVPETADELYEVLKAFKERDPNGNGIADEIPMSGVSSEQTMGCCALLWMFDTMDDFYVDGNKVKFGALEPEFKEGLAYIAKLYKEKLLDPDYLVQDRAKMDGKITNNLVGFVYSFQPTKISTLMAEKDPSFKLEGIGHFKNSDGVRKSYLPNYANSVLQTGLAISSSNPNPEGTLKWIDWVFGEEGRKAMNYGRKNDTYTEKDGEIKFTDKVLNNPDGLSVSDAFARYSAACSSDFPNLQDWNAYSQNLSTYGNAAINTWATDVDISGIMPVLTFEDGEKEIVSDIMNRINTYVDENIDKVILGRAEVDEWGKVIDAIKNMGIDKVLDIYQKAFDRYQGK